MLIDQIETLQNGFKILGQDSVSEEFLNISIMTLRKLEVREKEIREKGKIFDKELKHRGNEVKQHASTLEKSLKEALKKTTLVAESFIRFIEVFQEQFACNIFEINTELFNC